MGLFLFKLVFIGHHREKGIIFEVTNKIVLSLVNGKLLHNNCCPFFNTKKPEVDSFNF
jgi:hypothetical protein